MYVLHYNTKLLTYVQLIKDIAILKSGLISSTVVKHRLRYNYNLLMLAGA